MQNNLFKYALWFIGCAIIVLGGWMMRQQQMQLQILNAKIEALSPVAKDNPIVSQNVELPKRDVEAEKNEARQVMIDSQKGIVGKIQKIDGDALIVEAQVSDPEVMKRFDPFNPEPMPIVSKTIRVVVNEATKFVGITKQALKQDDLIGVKSADSIVDKDEVIASEIALVKIPEIKKPK